MKLDRILSKGIFRVSVSLLMTVILAMAVLPCFVRADISQPDIEIPTLAEVTCSSYCVYDKTADEIILSKNPHDRIYPASMTKIMTAQLGLDYLDIDDYLTVSQNALDNVTTDSTLMYVTLDEEVKVSELIYGMMLPSGNDAANVVAEGVIDAIYENYPADGDEVGPDGINASYFEEVLGVSGEEILESYKLSAFAELMNLRAENIGCTATHFVNANGLHSDDHYTTASDLALIMSKACENPDFNTVINSPTHIFEATNAHPDDGWSVVRNTNSLLTDPWLASKTAEGEDTHLTAYIGGKTGTTSAAGTGVTSYCVNENGHELFVSVCGIPSENYSNRDMYVASVVAYGNLQCWENDPVTVIPGTVGDYQRFNWPVDERPQYDPLLVPGDELTQDYMPEEFYQIRDEEEETGETEEDGDAVVEEGAVDTEDGSVPVSTPTPTPMPGTKEYYKAKVLDTSIGQFVYQNRVISLIVLVLVLLIIICTIVLIARITSGARKMRKKKGARPFTGNIDSLI
ncbi:MAG: D-alanyl-D-alanine carboxypeptidase [Clostridiales bacterium]|nr:D-alanyl-D-alanine carboxypeptidase [Clostridiales bacterium]